MKGVLKLSGFSGFLGLCQKVTELNERTQSDHKELKNGPKDLQVRK